MEFLPQELEDFIDNHTEQENEVLAELNRETNAKVLVPRMLSGHLQGRVLSMFSHMIRPKRILEVGTYTGYSAICMAEGMTEDGMLHTIDINEELEAMVKKYLEKAELQDRVKQHIGNALEIIPELDEEWDMVFIDADKENYVNYYDLVIDHVKPGGYIIADNVLWSGKVTEPYDSLDEETQTIVDYCKKTHEDERVQNVLFPVRDGLMVSRKR